MSALAWLLFWEIALTWAAMAAFYALRFFYRRRPESLVIALGFTAPALFVARELRVIPKLPLYPFLAAWAALGLFGFLVVFNEERQQPRGKHFGRGRR